MCEKTKPGPRFYEFHPGDWRSYGESTLGSLQQRAALIDYLYWKWREKHG